MAKFKLQCIKPLQDVLEEGKYYDVVLYNEKSPIGRLFDVKVGSFPNKHNIRLYEVDGKYCIHKYFDIKLYERKLKIDIVLNGE